MNYDRFYISPKRLKVTYSAPKCRNGDSGFMLMGSGVLREPEASAKREMYRCLAIEALCSSCCSYSHSTTCTTYDEVSVLAVSGTYRSKVQG